MGPGIAGKGSSSGVRLTFQHLRTGAAVHVQSVAGQAAAMLVQTRAGLLHGTPRVSASMPSKERPSERSACVELDVHGANSKK